MVEWLERLCYGAEGRRGRRGFKPRLGQAIVRQFSLLDKLSVIFGFC